MFLIPLNLDLDKFQDVLDVVEVVSLADQFFLYVLHSLTVLLIEILKGVHQIDVLEGDEGLLEDAEIEHLDLRDCIGRHTIGQCLQHKHDIHMFIQRGLGHNGEASQEGVHEEDLLLGDLVIRHVDLIDHTLLAAFLTLLLGR